jgi:alcohol dehydrogenase class IV
LPAWRSPIRRWLPHVLKFNNTVASETYAEIAPIVFPALAEVSDARARSDLFAEHLADLAAKLGLQTRLRDVGISEADLPKMASDAMKQTRLLVNNPRELGEMDAFDIYKAAL